MIRTIQLNYDENNVVVDTIKTFFEYIGLCVIPPAKYLNENTIIPDYSFHFSDEKNMKLSDVGNIFSAIVEEMCMNGVITEQEMGDMEIASNIFLENDMYKLISFSVNIFPLFFGDANVQTVEKLAGITEAFISKLNEFNLLGWGDKNHRILQYTALRFATEANIYSKGTNVGYAYDIDSLVSCSDKLIIGDKYDNAFLILSGKNNNFVLNQNNVAYHNYYKIVYKNEKEYNSEIFHLIGKQKYRFFFKEDEALKYYEDGMKINPIDYNLQFEIIKLYEHHLKDPKCQRNLWSYIDLPWRELKSSALDSCKKLENILKEVYFSENIRQLYLIFQAHLKSGLLYKRDGKFNCAIKEQLAGEKIYDNLHDLANCGYSMDFIDTKIKRLFNQYMYTIYYELQDIYLEAGGGKEYTKYFKKCIEFRKYLD